MAVEARLARGGLIRPPGQAGPLLGRASRPARVAAIVVTLGYGWWATALPPFSTGALAAVLAFGLVEIGLAELRRRRPGTPATPRPITVPSRPDGATSSSWRSRDYLVWVSIIAVAVVWELVALSGHPRAAHPTISSITDPLQAHHVVRWLFYDAWVWFGWALAS